MNPDNPSFRTPESEQREEDLRKENIKLKMLIDMFFIYEGEDGQGYVQFGHPEMKDGCALTFQTQSMVGNVILNYAKIMKKVKEDVGIVYNTKHGDEEKTPTDQMPKLWLPGSK